MNKSSNDKKHIAQLIGTYMSLLMGCGSAVLADSIKRFVDVSPLSVFSCSLRSMLKAAFLVATKNPAVHIYMLAAGKISARPAVYFVTMQ